MMRTPRPGFCYQDALLMFIENGHQQNWLLVHGYPRLSASSGDHPAGTKYGHAWIEINGTVVLEVTMEKVVPRDLYYLAGCIDNSEVVRYTYKEAIVHASQYNHSGPWATPPVDAVFKKGPV